MVFDFIDGGAGDESSQARNLSAFEDLCLEPRVLLRRSVLSTERRFLGEIFGAPFGICPMGMCGLAHPRADRSLAEEAVKRKIPVCLSTSGSTAIEDMRMMAGDFAWFQLYATPSGEQTMDLVRRAADSGYRNLVVTGDLPVISKRRRDLRNGFTLPFRLKPRHAVDFALHPRWTIEQLIHGPPRLANYSGKWPRFDRDGDRSGADWRFIERLRHLWTGNLIVKGVMSADDASRIRRLGADAVWVSNHGGRQLASAPASLPALRHIRCEVGPDCPILFDSGVRSGEDIIKALALGADFVMLGRPVLFALAGGGPGGLGSFLDSLSGELKAAMAQVGLSSLDCVGRQILCGLADA